MSISSTLTSALSGLTASSRAAGLVSSNIANALTEGYAARSLTTGTRVIGSNGTGVQILGIERQEDTVLLGQRRAASADLGANQTKADFLSRLEAILGAPDDPGSLSAQMADFEGRLIAAANTPWNSTLLSNAVQGAQSIAETLNSLSSDIQHERKLADAAIGRSVDQINTALDGLAKLNVRILSASSGSDEIASLMDAQNQLVEQIAPLIPLQSRRDDNGTLNIFSDDGHILLSHRAAELEFSPAPAMEPYLDISNGTLSGLKINGRDLQMNSAHPAFQGGQLNAMFDVRDTLAPEAQARLDGVAMDLSERFDAVGLDATVPAGMPGLFTDNGTLADSVNELGLSARLQVNSAVIPEEGGAVWRLRDGLGASTEGPSGNASFLTAQIDALAASRATSSPAFSATSRSMSALVAENLSIVGLERTTVELSLGRASAQHSALVSTELAGGVDTDAELQNLLRIEQMYAANARVMSVAEDMMDQLLRITG